MKTWKTILLIICIALFLPILKTLYVYDLENSITKVYANELEQKNNIISEHTRIKEFEIKQLQIKMNKKIVELKNKNGKASKIIDGIDKHLKGKLSNKGEVFFYAGNLYNVNPMLLAAISIHETGNGTSVAIKNKNNVGGIMANANLGILKNFEDIDLSIVEMSRIMKTYYIDMGLKDIESIGGKYCPEFVANDPTGINKHWVPSVSKYYKSILKDCEV